MSVLRDLMADREGWMKRQQAIALHHLHFMIVSELILLVEAAVCFVLYREAIAHVLELLLNG